MDINNNVNLNRFDSKIFNCKVNGKDQNSSWDVIYCSILLACRLQTVK